MYCPEPLYVPVWNGKESLEKLGEQQLHATVKLLSLALPFLNEGLKPREMESIETTKL